ncbi:hypothetical protein Tco_1425981 [Tanacetum coccineum]
MYDYSYIERAKEVGYEIRDVWVDPAEAIEEVAPTTLEGANARVTELAEVQEEDTQDLYALVEDVQDKQTLLSQRVDVLIEEIEFHQETILLIVQEALVSREAWAQSVGLSLAVHNELHAYRTHTQIQDYRQLSVALGQIQALQARDLTHADDPEGTDRSSMANNMPPKRTSTAAARAAAPMTAVAIDHSDRSHNSDTGIRGTVRISREYTYKDFMNCQPLTSKGTEGVVVLSQWFEKMESVFHISNCFVENQVKFATCTFLGNALTWWNSYMKTVT